MLKAGETPLFLLYFLLYCSFYVAWYLKLRECYFQNYIDLYAII